LDEVLQIEIPLLRSLGLSDRSKGVDDHNGWARRFDFVDDARQELIQCAADDVLAEIDEADRLIHSFHIEERVLLLIAQHLEGWLAHNGEVHGVTFRTGKAKHDLLRERGLARAG